MKAECQWEVSRTSPEKSAGEGPQKRAYWESGPSLKFGSQGWAKVGWAYVLCGLVLGFVLGCSSSASRKPSPHAGSLTLSSIGVPYGAKVQCSHPTLPEPLTGYFHDYRNGYLVLNSGMVPYDSTTTVEMIDAGGTVHSLCDTLELAAQWSVLAEGQWATFYGFQGRTLARGRLDLVLPDTVYITAHHLPKDSVCRVDIAWADQSEMDQGWLSIPVTVGKTVIKVAGMVPVMAWALVTDDSQPLKRWMDW